MKQLLIILFTVFSVQALGQNAVGRNNYYVTPSEEEKAFYSDDFEGYNTDADLDGQGDWIQVTGYIKVIDNSGDEVIAPNLEEKSYYYYNQSLSDNQYAEVAIDNIVEFKYVGPSVRGSTSAVTCYYWYSSSTVAYLRRIVAGSMTTLATGDPFVVGSTYRLEVNGDVLSCYKDGVLDTSIDTDGEYTDDSVDKLTSGYAGCMMYGNGFSYADEYECGEL